MGPEDATKMLSRLEQLCYEDKLRKLGLFILKRRMLQGDLIAAFQFLKKAYKKKKDRKRHLFTWAACDCSWGNNFELKGRDLND